MYSCRPGQVMTAPPHIIVIINEMLDFVIIVIVAVGYLLGYLI